MLVFANSPNTDKNKEDGAEEKFKRIVQAKEVLTDASARRTYDAEVRVKSAASGFGGSGFGGPGFGGSSGYGFRAGAAAYGGYAGSGRYQRQSSWPNSN